MDTINHSKREGLSPLPEGKEWKDRPYRFIPAPAQTAPQAASEIPSIGHERVSRRTGSLPRYPSAPLLIQPSKSASREKVETKRLFLSPSGRSDVPSRSSSSDESIPPKKASRSRQKHSMPTPGEKIKASVESKREPTLLIPKALIPNVCEELGQFHLLQGSEIKIHDAQLKPLLHGVIETAALKPFFIDPKSCMRRHCLNEVIIAFAGSQMTVRHLLSLAEELSMRIFRDLVHPKCLLKESMSHLEVLRQELWSYLQDNNARSPWSTALYTVVVQLLGAKTLIEFISILEKEGINSDNIKGANAHSEGKKGAAAPFRRQKKSLSAVKQQVMGSSQVHGEDASVVTGIQLFGKEVILRCFGRYSDEIHATIEQIYAWSNPLNSISIQNQIQEQISKVAPLVEKSRTITKRTHRFYQKVGKSPFHMGTITCSSIKRSLMPDDMVLPDEILINGKSCLRTEKPLHPQVLISTSDRPSNKFNQPDGDTLKVMANSTLIKFENDYEFFYHLFRSIYNATDEGKIHSLILKREVQQFLELANDLEIRKDTSHYGRGNSLRNRTFNRDIPCLGLLRLMTIDCRLHGNSYLRLLFPKLFVGDHEDNETQKYELDYGKDTICEIAIDHAGGYYVTQKKKAAVYLAHNERCKLPGGSLDKGAPIATLGIEWTVGPITDGWEGALKICSWEIHDLDHWIDLTSMWTHPQDPSKSIHAMRGIEYAPDIGL
jgi:hypothetical protein